MKVSFVNIMHAHADSRRQIKFLINILIVEKILSDFLYRPDYAREVKNARSKKHFNKLEEPDLANEYLAGGDFYEC